MTKLEKKALAYVTISAAALLFLVSDPIEALLVCTVIIFATIALTCLLQQQEKDITELEKELETARAQAQRYKHIAQYGEEPKE